MTGRGVIGGPAGGGAGNSRGLQAWRHKQRTPEVRVCPWSHLASPCVLVTLSRVVSSEHGRSHVASECISASHPGDTLGMIPPQVPALYANQHAHHLHLNRPDAA